MRIKGCFRKIVEDFENGIIKREKLVGKADIIEWIESSWKNLRIFYKNIDPKVTKEHDELLESIDEKEIVITKEMFNEALKLFKDLQYETEDIGSFISRYFLIVDVLLFFNTPNENDCDYCQSGSYEFFFDEDLESIVKICYFCNRGYKYESCCWAAA